MYSKEELDEVECFKNKDIDILLDDLTRTLSRPYIIEYVQHLIKNNISFSLSLLDIDNFKDVNDKYGHQMGDKVIAHFGQRIVTAVGKTGFVGRYGGDEFLIVTPNLQTYDERWKYLRNLLLNAFRSEISVNNINLRMTATVGSAAYPSDASNYEKLFNMVDKALYRGKQKGRNCFIIYNEALHYKINIDSPQGRVSLYQVMNRIGNILAKNEPFENILKYAFDVTMSYCALTDVYFITKKCKNYISTTKERLEIPYDVIDEARKDLKTDGIKVINNNDELNGQFPKLYDFCKNDVVKAFNVTQVQASDEEYGYLVFADRDRKRIWQTDEIILFVFFSKMLGVVIQNRNLKEQIKK